MLGQVSTGRCARLAPSLPPLCIATNVLEAGCCINRGALAFTANAHMLMLLSATRFYTDDVASGSHGCFTGCSARLEAHQLLIIGPSGKGSDASLHVLALCRHCAELISPFKGLSSAVAVQIGQPVCCYSDSTVSGKGASDSCRGSCASSNRLVC